MKGAYDIAVLTEKLDRLAAGAGFERVSMGTIGDFELVAYERLRPNAPLIYVSAGIHGDEPAGPLAVERFFEEGGFCDELSWMICPMLNPTGLARGTRENADGVDLNRDYLSRETAEVQAHVAWLERHPSPDVVLSLHEDWESTGFYLYEINCAACISDAEEVIKAVSRVFPPEPETRIDDHDVRKPGWIFHEAEADEPGNWPEAIWLAKNGAAVSYTFETPSSAGLEQRVDAQLRAVRSAVRCFLKRHCS